MNINHQGLDVIHGRTIMADDCELLTIKRTDFEGILSQNETIALKVYKAFTRALCDRLRQANENLIVAHQMGA